MRNYFLIRIIIIIRHCRETKKFDCCRYYALRVNILIFPIEKMNAHCTLYTRQAARQIKSKIMLFQCVNSCTPHSLVSVGSVWHSDAALLLTLCLGNFRFCFASFFFALPFNFFQLFICRTIITFYQLLIDEIKYNKFQGATTTAASTPIECLVLNVFFLIQLIFIHKNLG